MKHDMEIMQLARHNQAIAKIETRIRALREHLARPPVRDAHSALPLTFTSGHFDTWQRWVEQELARLNIKLARCRADREEFIDNARQAFGRKEVTAALLQRETEKHHKLQQKKAEDAQ